MPVKLDSNLFRKGIMEALGVNVNEEFYLKLYKEKTTQQYQKLPKEGYLGIRDYDMGACFLVRFKFLPNTYEFSSDCAYMSLADYEKVFQGLIAGEYVAVKQISLKNRFFIQIIDNISIEEIEAETFEDIPDPNP